MIINKKQLAKSAVNNIGSAVKRPMAYIPFALVVIAAIFFLPGIIRNWKVKIEARKLAAKNKAALAAIEAAGGIVSGELNNSTHVDHINLQVSAQTIADCLYNNDWFGASEDEDGVIEVLKSVPDNMVTDLAYEYEKINPKPKEGNMYKQIIKLIDKSDLVAAGVWAKINR